MDSRLPRSLHEAMSLIQTVAGPTGRGMSFRALARRWLPHGNTLSAAAWNGRHRLVVWVAGLHIPVLGAVGLINGETFVHVGTELMWIAVLLAASLLVRKPWPRAVLGALAITTASALLVHFTGGLIESHFHFFVVLPLLALYADWRPFGAAVLYVAVHHGLVGTLNPNTVYNHYAALQRPLLWGAIHAGYVLLLCAVMIVHWRLSDDEREATEAAVRRLEEVVASKDELIASVSHEIRTPLTGILGITTELATAPDQFSQEEHTALLANVASEAQELAHLVEDLLTSARARSGTLTVISEDFDLSELVQSVLGSPTFRTTHLSCMIDEGVWATADPLRVRQIVRNLVTNAQRYGGPAIEIRVFAHDDDALFEVWDDGPGLHPTVADRAFEAYVTVGGHATMPKSIGLGLSVSTTLAASMAGSVSYRRSKDEEHSVFSLSLPAAAPPTCVDTPESTGIVTPT